MHQGSTTLLEILAARNKPFPLHALLALYYRAHPKDVYIEHMHGFRLLVDWLSPIALPINPVPLYYYRVTGTWEHQNIAQILATYPAIIQATEFYIQGCTAWTPDY